MQTSASDALIIFAIFALWIGFALSAHWLRRWFERLIEVEPIRKCKQHYCPDCEQIYTCPADTCRMPYLCRHADAGMECAPIGVQTSVPVAGG